MMPGWLASQWVSVGHFAQVLPAAQACMARAGRMLGMTGLAGLLAWHPLTSAAPARSAARAGADPDKVLHIAFEAADDGMDTVRANSLYTSWLASNIFETLLRYDYLARPSKLVPGTAEAMPEISRDGTLITVRIKKGIYFTADPAFKGARHELTAEDYVYSLKRAMDPVVHSAVANDYEDKLVGLDEAVLAARKRGKFDYDAPIEGVRALDRYTIQFHLKKPNYTFLYQLADPGFVAVARQVVEAYGDDIGRHPVGTGPYMLKHYVPRSKIILEANPDYRGFVWDFQSSGEAWDAHVIAEMKGKHMPQIGRVEVSIIEEHQSRWLAFDSGQLDVDLLAESATPLVLDKDKLKPAYAKRGYQLYRFPESATVRTFFNLRDPTIGGYSKEKIALRRALMMAFDMDALKTQAYFDQAVKAQSDVPPGVAGFDPHYQSSIQYNPAFASLLLDRFGYKKGADGFRTQPDGKPLVVKVHGAPNARDTTILEIWRHSLQKIGVQTQFEKAGFADNLKASYLCQVPMFGMGFTAGIPDASDFLTSYYGPNALRGNYGCYQSKVYDQAFQQAKLLPDGPERNALIRTMNRQLEMDGARLPELWRIRNWITQPWVKGYKKHPIMWGDWMYLDIEKH